MDFTQATITGVIQGLTEFLPVSSSGHLVLTASIYKLLTGKALASGGSEEIFFDIMLHVGTLIAVLVYFRQDIVNIIQAFLKGIKDGSIKTNYEAQLPVYIVIGTFATALVAYPLKDKFEALVHQPAIVGLVLIATGTLLYSTEYISQKYVNTKKQITWKKSLLIGIAQGLAVAPGLSRSGSTIAAGLASGLDRVTCARYSFLLSIPIIILAALFHSLEMLGSAEFAQYNLAAIMVGTVVSGIVGYYCIKYFIQFISRHKLNVFALYCWIVGAGMFIYFGYFV